MPYAILRFAKKKMGGVSAAYLHNERKKEAYKSNPDIALDRSQDNYHLVQPKQNYRYEVKQLITAAGCKVRSNSTVMVETLITASPEFMNDLPKKEQQEFFSRAFEFISEKIGKDNIISAVVHMDEKTPHMHLSFCPITKDKRLSAKTILGNQAQLSKWQTDFHAAMSNRWDVLERGTSSMITQRKHIPLWLYKQAERLDRQFVAVSEALAHINAFNAGKQRDKALKLLSEWLPSAERFTAQIKTVDGALRSLERSKKADTQTIEKLKEKAAQQDDSLFLASLEVKNLKAKIEKQQRLLDQLSPDLKDALQQQKKGRDTR